MKYCIKIGKGPERLKKILGALVNIKKMCKFVNSRSHNEEKNSYIFD